MAREGVSVAHCPSSNLKLASGIAPVAAMRARGIRVGVGTDGAASNNRLDVLTEMRTAALLAKVASGDAAVVPAQRGARDGDDRGRARPGPRARDRLHRARQVGGPRRLDLGDDRDAAGASIRSPTSSTPRAAST